MTGNAYHANYEVASCPVDQGILDPAEKAFRQRLRENGGISQTRFSQAKIKQATNNFGNSIGSGGFGNVYHGKLPDGQEIAAKVLSAESHQSKQEFYNEVGAPHIWLHF